MKKYEIIKRNFSNSAWISAPDNCAPSDELPPECDFENAMWIWPKQYVRRHLRKNFTLKKEIKSACAQFICDNKFDIYINGKQLSVYKDTVYRCNETDISSMLTQGVNRIGIRTYQTNDPMHFTSALCGGIRIEYADGKEQTVLTDSDWTAHELCGFYEQKETEEWMVTDNPGRPSPLEVQEIHPRIIKRSCIFSKEFIADKPVKSACIHITSLGLRTLSLNGESICSDMFVSGSCEKYIEYLTYDITQKLHRGENKISVMLGSGWLNCESWGTINCHKPALIAEIYINYDDGTQTVIGTDSSWCVGPSPLVDNDIQFGERYDARLTDTPQYYCAKVIKDAPVKQTVMQNYPSVRITAVREPINTKKLSSGVYLFDFGVNTAGRAHIQLTGTKRGQMIKIRYCERLHADGTPNTGPYMDVYYPDDNLPDGCAKYAARNMDVYICRGDGQEEYMPTFAYTGARYVYIEGLEDLDQLENIQFCTMNTDLDFCNEFSCGFKPFEDILNAVIRSYRSNIFSGPTDCPTREKNFWNGDIQAFAATACYIADDFDFLARWTDGGRKIQYDIYGWEDEEYILPYILYTFYGDKEILRVKYPVIKKLIEKREKSVSGILPDGEKAPYRDHKAVANVPGDFYAACYHCLMYSRAAEIASILGDDESAKNFESKFEICRAEFNSKYYIDGDYTPQCQAAIVFALAFGLADDENRISLAAKLNEYVIKEDYKINTGFMSTEHILRLLCDFGYKESALKMMMQTEYPSPLYLLSTGATTTTESWSGMDEPFEYDSMNHYALGSFARWFYECLGGIRPGENGGFEKFILKPTFYAELGYVNTKYKSPFGEINSTWHHIGNNKFKWSFILPQGSCADVILPNGKKEIYKSGEYTITV